MVRFGDVPDQQKNIWHETKSECRIYNLHVGSNIIANYSVDITKMYLNYAYFKDEETRRIFNDFIAMSDTLEEFQCKNAKRADQFYFDWSKAHVTILGPKNFDHVPPTVSTPPKPSMKPLIPTPLKPTNDPQTNRPPTEAPKKPLPTQVNRLKGDNYFNKSFKLLDPFE